MKKVLQSFLGTLFLLSLFFLNESIVLGAEKNFEEVEIGTFPLELKVKGTEEVDGKIVTVYEDLPDKFTVYENSGSLVKTVSLDDEISPACASCNYTIQTKQYQWIDKGDYNFGWHPQFDRFRRVDGYTFSVTSSVSMGASVSWGFVSFSVAQSSSAGYFIKADYDRFSRPAIFGQLIVTNYKLETYNPAGKLLETTYKNYPRADRVYEKVLYE